MVGQRYEYFRVLKTIFNKRAQQVSKILFSTRKKIFMSSSIPCNVLFIIWLEGGLSEQRTYKSCGKTYMFFTSENMQNTSVLVYGETPITI